MVISQPSASAPLGDRMPVTWLYVNGGVYAIAFSTASITTPGANLEIVRNGSTFSK